jgi:acyl carrier protein
MTSHTPTRHAEILQQVQQIVSEVVGVDDLVLTPATTAGDVDGWDSIANIQIFIAIERAYKFRFRTGEITGIPNVGALVDRIAARIQR